MDGKVAVITGAGSGMAKSCAELFVRHGARVVAADISGKQEETAAELGDAAIPVQCDVTQEDQVEAMFATALEAFDRVDAVLNVAGIGAGAPLVDMELDAYEQIMAIDLRGVFLGTKHGIQAIRRSGEGGSIVNWSSLTAFAHSGSYSSIYASAKAGVIALTTSAALEHGAEGIRVNAVCPGIILTEMGKMAVEFDPTKVEKPPMQRAGEPEEVAELALFLSSERSSYITGVAIPIDGGWKVRLA
jgi:NAD(P)-dependent dehydrogenase (short-subunit alcohol dehydrogenase family)